MVADDRYVNASEAATRLASEAATRLMQGLVALESKGLVLHAFDPSQPELGGRVLHKAASLYWFDTPHDVSGNIRYYPILARDPDGPREAMALRIARAYLGLDTPADPASLQHPSGYQFSPDLLLPTIYRPSKTAAEQLWDYDLQINYVGPPGSFSSVPLSDVLDRKVPPGFFRDKIVFIDLPLDVQGSPASVSRPMLGAEMDANAVQSILDRHFLVDQNPWREIATVWVVLILGGLLFGRLRAVLGVPMLVTLLAAYIGYAAVLYRRGVVADTFFGSFALVGAFISISVTRFISEERARRREEEEKRRIRDTFGHYVAENVVERILQDPGAVQ